MDSKSEECVFIGYTKGVKGYKLLKEKTKIVFHNKDVVSDKTLGEVHNKKKKFSI